MNPAVIIAAIYARRSTDEHQAASLEVQIEEAKRYIESMGWIWRDDCIFIEDAVSRAEFQKRPALIAMLNAAEQKKFSVIVVRDETRLGGDMVRTCLVIQDIIEAGCRLVYYYTGEDVRVDDATARFMVAARNFAAELEREKLTQRTHEHLLTKARKGFVAGGKVYGYDNKEIVEGDRRVRVEYVVNADQAEVVRDIFRRHAAGQGLRAIAKALNAGKVPSPREGKRGTGSWGPSQIRSMLNNERYRGIAIWNRMEKSYRKGTKVRVKRPECEWVRVENPALRIVDEDLWTRAHIQTHVRAPGIPKKAGRPARHLLSGLARCARCGGPIAVTNGKAGHEVVRVYTCSQHKNRGTCSSTFSRPKDGVDAVVIDWVLNEVLNEKVVLATLRELRERLAARARTTSTEMPALERESKNITNEINRLVQAVAKTDKPPEPLISAIAERQARLSALDARIRAMKVAPDALGLEVRRMEAEARRRIGDLRGMLQRNPEEGRKVIASLLKGPIILTPVETPQGKRFRIEADAVPGRIFSLEGEKPPSPNSASPTRFELVYQG